MLSLPLRMIVTFWGAPLGMNKKTEDGDEGPGRSLSPSPSPLRGEDRDEGFDKSPSLPPSKGEGLSPSLSHIDHLL